MRECAEQVDRVPVPMCVFCNPHSESRDSILLKYTKQMLFSMTIRCDFHFVFRSVGIHLICGARGMNPALTPLNRACKISPFREDEGIIMMTNTDRTQIHISGIGGVGMSAIAQALIDQGAVVTGSDRLLDQGDRTATLTCLENQGVLLSPQDGRGITSATARLVVSSAIENDNPDVIAARAAGLPIVHRSEELAALLRGRTLIAVTGTCGKSTVTALLGWLLEGVGADPLVVNGAAVVGWDKQGHRIGSVRSGKGTLAVIEADESDKSLMNFHPQHAIITNASADHFGLEETLSLFSSFRQRVPGVLVEGDPDADVMASFRSEGWHGFFTYEGVTYEVPMPGRHNLFNAYHAVRMARALGYAGLELAAVLKTFQGVDRRLQRVGVAGQTVVIDDYAHNPDKLSAAWTTLAAAFPQGICAVWRPHGFAPLRKMLDDLVEAFSRVIRPCDTFILLPVYDAGGTADRSIDSDVLASRLEAKGVKVLRVSGLEEAEQRLREAIQQKIGAVVTFGARDPGLPRLAQRLAEVR